MPDVRNVVFETGLVMALVIAEVEALGIEVLTPSSGPRTFEVIDLCQMGPPSCVDCTGLPDCKPCPRAGIAQRPQKGFAIAVSKFDPQFSEKVGRGLFRYKHEEMLAVFGTVIAESPELLPEVHWDRGCGVYVYNLFFADATVQSHV